MSEYVIKHIFYNPSDLQSSNFENNEVKRVISSMQTLCFGDSNSENRKMFLDIIERPEDFSIDKIAIVNIFKKNKRTNSLKLIDQASGLLQKHDWLGEGKPQFWLTDICRRVISERSRPSPVRVLFDKFDEYVLSQGESDIWLMVKKHSIVKPGINLTSEEVAAKLIQAYNRYGFKIATENETDFYMKKSLFAGEKKSGGRRKKTRRNKRKSRKRTRKTKKKRSKLRKKKRRSNRRYTR